ncbi:MAG: MFS transporter [Opitutus sp.]|nr:MFS transporter [Opitutus sp.]
MSSAPAKQENLFVNLAFNIAIPALIMGQLSEEKFLGPKWGLVIALLFPLGYGIYDFVQRRKTNFVSVLGFTGVLLSGVFGLMKLDGRWFAVKEAAIPAVIGLAVIASMRARAPLVKTLLMNDAVIDTAKLEARLRERGAEAGFAAVLRRCTLLVAFSFFVSAVLNYALARWLLTSPGGTPEFNAQLAKMQWLSWPVIVLPSMVMLMIALWQLVKGITALTGLTTDEIFRTPEKK